MEPWACFLPAPQMESCWSLRTRSSEAPAVANSAQGQQLLSQGRFSPAKHKMVWHCWSSNWEKTWPLLRPSPHNTWWPGTTNPRSTAAMSHSPRTGAQVVRWLKTWGTVGPPGTQNWECKEGTKKSHSKSSLPSSHAALLSAPPAHLRGSHLEAFGPELPQPGFSFPPDC